MRLKARFFKWSAGVPVAMLNDVTAEKLGVHAQDRISIKTTSKKNQEFSTIIDTVGSLIKKDEIGLSIEIKERLNLRKNQILDIAIAPNPESLNLIKRKLKGKKLKKKQIREIIEDITNNELSEAEIALFVSAMYDKGMTTKETIFLIESLLETGHKLNLKNKIIVDKHSIGGVPGNRTTPLVVSICAAAGLIIPKNSSRAITSPAGTADVIETIAEIGFSVKELKKIVKKTKACMIWGGALGLVPADSRIIQVEKTISLDPEAQLLASIMSKKLSAGSNHILIDIPFGDEAKMNKKKALRLKKKFKKLAKHFNRKMKVVLTKGNEPIGNGIGPALELIDVISILDPKKQGPKDLQEKSIFLCSQIFKLVGKKQPEKLAKHLLESGQAFEKFKEIIIAQNGSIQKINSLQKTINKQFKKTIYASKKVKIKNIENKDITILARTAGCPADKFSGLYLYAKEGNEIKKGEPIITIYAESRARLNQALKIYQKIKPIKFNN